MDNRHNILTELKAISEVVSGIAPITPYEAPVGYFESLPTIILNRVKALEAKSVNEEISTLSPLLSGLRKKPSFTIPKGYFNELPENVVAGTKAIDFVKEELESLPPVLSQLKHKKVYEVPVGYFDSFPDMMLNKVRGKKAAPVVQMSFAKKIFAYASAAMIAGIVAVTVWWTMKPAGSESPDAPAVLANIDKVSDNELQRYVETQMPELNETATYVSTEDMNASDLDDMLADVSEEELQQYLEKNDNIKKLLTN